MRKNLKYWQRPKNIKGLGKTAKAKRGAIMKNILYILPILITSLTFGQNDGYSDDDKLIKENKVKSSTETTYQFGYSLDEILITEQSKYEYDTCGNVIKWKRFVNNTLTNTTTNDSGYYIFKYDNNCNILVHKDFENNELKNESHYTYNSKYERIKWECIGHNGYINARSIYVHKKGTLIKEIYYEPINKIKYETKYYYNRHRQLIKVKDKHYDYYVNKIKIKFSVIHYKYDKQKRISLKKEIDSDGEITFTQFYYENDNIMKEVIFNKNGRNETYITIKNSNGLETEWHMLINDYIDKKSITNYIYY